MSDVLTGPVLIGEAPPGFPTSRHQPLYPNPVGCTGHRLLVLTGLTIAQYIMTFTRVNLLPAAPLRWNKATRATAAGMADIMRPYLQGRRALLMGAQVRDAFGLAECQPLFWKHEQEHELAWMPHPSGRNTWYNVASNKRAVESFFKEWVAGIIRPAGPH